MALGVAGSLGLAVRPAIPVFTGSLVMAGWILIVAILGAVWLMFRD
jgi:hypothetical protein